MDDAVTPFMMKILLFMLYMGLITAIVTIMKNSGISVDIIKIFAVVSLAGPIVAWVAWGIVRTHRTVLRFVLILFVPSYEEKERKIGQVLRNHTLAALPDTWFIPNTVVEAWLALNWGVSPRFSAGIAKRVTTGAETDKAEIRLSQRELDNIAEGIRSEARNQMNGIASALSIYCSSGRALGVNLKMHSQHDAIAALGKAKKLSASPSAA